MSRDMRWSHRHEVIAMCIAVGQAPQEVAKAFGLSICQVYRIINSTQGAAKIAEYQARLFEQLAQASAVAGIFQLQDVITERKNARKRFRERK